MMGAEIISFILANSQPFFAMLGMMSLAPAVQLAVLAFAAIVACVAVLLIGFSMYSGYKKWFKPAQHQEHEDQEDESEDEPEDEPEAPPQLQTIEAISLSFITYPNRTVVPVADPQKNAYVAQLERLIPGIENGQYTSISAYVSRYVKTDVVSTPEFQLSISSCDEQLDTLTKVKPNLVDIDEQEINDSKVEKAKQDLQKAGEYLKKAKQDLQKVGEGKKKAKQDKVVEQVEQAKQAELDAHKAYYAAVDAYKKRKGIDKQEEYVKNAQAQMDLAIKNKNILQLPLEAQKAVECEQRCLAVQEKFAVISRTIAVVIGSNKQPTLKQKYDFLTTKVDLLKAVRALKEQQYRVLELACDVESYSLTKAESEALIPAKQELMLAHEALEALNVEGGQYEKELLDAQTVLKRLQPTVNAQRARIAQQKREREQQEANLLPNAAADAPDAPEPVVLADEGVAGPSEASEGEAQAADHVIVEVNEGLAPVQDNPAPSLDPKPSSKKPKVKKKHRK